MQTDDTKYKFFKLNRRSQTYSVRSSSIFHSIFESLAYKMEEIHESCRIFFLKPRRQLIFWTQTGGGSGVGTFAARPEKSSKESGSARPRSSTCPTGPTRPIPLPRGDFTSDKVNNIMQHVGRRGGPVLAAAERFGGKIQTHIYLSSAQILSLS